MILVTGTLAYDQIMDFPGKFCDSIMPDKIHMLNVSFLVDNLRKGFGGTAGNIAYTLSLLGIKCAVMGIVGPDFADYQKFLKTYEVDTSYVRIVNNLYTSQAFGITDSGDNQIWGFYGGADMMSDSLSVNDVQEKIDFGIIGPHNPRAMLKFAGEYKKKKIPYLFDPGMELPYLSGDNLKEAFAGAKIIIGNDYEIKLMEKKTGIAPLSKLSKQRKIIITTTGEEGSKVYEKEKEIKITPAKVRNCSDPTGAGDAFRAGFLAGYLRELPLKICGQMGSVASAYTVELYGTTTHNFSVKDFERRYKENYGEMIQL